MRADPAAYYFAVSRGLRVDAKNLWLSEAPLKENNGHDQISRKKVGAFGARVRLSWKHMDSPVWNFLTRKHFNQNLYRVKLGLFRKRSWRSCSRGTVIYEH